MDTRAVFTVPYAEACWGVPFREAFREAERTEGSEATGSQRRNEGTEVTGKFSVVIRYLRTLR